MKCVNCGREIASGSRFCTFCGAKQPRYCIRCGHPIQDDAKFCEFCGQDQSQPVRNDNAGSAIDRLGDEIGGGIDDAVNDVRNSFHANRNNNAFSEGVNQAGTEIHDAASEIGGDVKEAAGKVKDTADDVKKNWKDYLTPDNMEILVAVSPLFPLFFALVHGILGWLASVILRFFYKGIFGLIGNVFGALPVIAEFIFFAASILAIAAAVYLLLAKPEKRTTWGYIGAASTVIGFLGCLSVIRGWTALEWILIIAGIFWGLDLYSRVAIRKTGMESVPDPSVDFGVYQTAYADYKAAKETAAEKEARRIAEDPYASYFDGTGGQLIGTYIVGVLLSVITCGLYTPWFICKVYRWRKSHTVINGRRLAFNGTGGSLLGHWILWDILDIITCGIYSFFEHVALLKWEMKHTTYADEPNAEGLFDGNSFQYFGYGLIEGLLLLITCGLAWPWTFGIINRWETRHQKVSNDRMYYDGTAGGIFVQYLIAALLTIVTIGIYYPWALCRINRYVYAHTHVNYQAQ